MLPLLLLLVIPAEPTVVRTATSGPWSDPTTWEGGRVPTAGVKVKICPGHAVRYDVKSDAVIRSVHVAGVLAFADDRDTLLNAGLIRIHGGDGTEEEGFEAGAHAPKGAATPTPAEVRCACCDGKPALLVGTAERPIPARHTAVIRLHHVAGMDRDSCPAIVCCGGRMDIHGAPLSRTWVKLGADADGPDLTLAEPVSGWRVGDRVIVTGSSAAPGGKGTEERRLRSIAGRRLTLDRPLESHHAGAGVYRAEVANLSRNVVVESADPDGVRGHTMYHAGSSGGVGYAEFRHLGKKSVLGRYPLHFHLCRDTARGSSVIGASIWDSHNRWLTVHGTEYLVVRDCVGYKSVGHGFFLEDGTETLNVFDRNLAVQAVEGAAPPRQMLPFDKNEGAGFWWANSHNTFTRNVACECDGYGFRYEATPVNGPFVKVKKGEPRPGPFDLRLSVRRPDGGRAAVDVRTLPFVRFESNEAHHIGTYGLNLGQDAGPVGPDRDHPFVVRDMRIWLCGRGYTVHVPHVRVEGLRIHRCGYEVYRARYAGQDYRDVRLTGVRGKYTVAGLDDYRAAGQLNRTRLPGFPRGTGAGGTAYAEAEVEAVKLTPVDDRPPTTVITHVRRDGDRLIVRGTAADDGPVKRVRVGPVEARATAANHAEWEATLPAKSATLKAFAEDAAGNVERTPHELPVVVR